MNETQTPLDSQSPDTTQHNDDFDQIISMQNASEASRRMMMQDPVESRTLTTPETTSEKERSPTRLKKFGRNVIAAAVIALPIAGVAGMAMNASQAPEFSSETSTYMVLDGEGVQDAAESVLGSEAVNINEVVDHIETLPENQKVLEDGLQHGEVLVIPESIAGYEEEK